jgi:cytoskeletal protein CcmA (bactofilin family)
MWNKEAQPEVPGVSGSKDSKIPGAPANTPAGIRPSTPLARTLALLGSTIVVKGEISSDEDLQIDGRVEGPVSLRGNRLTVGRSGQLSSEVTAREVIVYGNVSGNLRARDRVEIKKDGRVIGDIATARISIEDGAYFKGHIEIEHTQSSAAPEKTEKKEAELIPVGAGAY